MQDAKSPESIKTIIEKMENVKKEVHVNEIVNINRPRTFANVIKERDRFAAQPGFSQSRNSVPTYQNRRSEPMRNGSQNGQKDNKTIICYGCRKGGHMKKDCTENTMVCYG